MLFTRNDPICFLSKVLLISNKWLVIGFEILAELLVTLVILLVILDIQKDPIHTDSFGDFNAFILLSIYDVK